MKISYQDISNVFQHSWDKSSTSFKAETEIGRLIFSCIEINKRLWKLEDVSRMHNLGFETVAKAKMEIDIVNQRRNETIRELDSLIDKHLYNVQLESPSKFYSESPGMLIDRLAILFIKQNFMRQLINQIDDKHLRNEYLEKEGRLNQNITELGLFTDLYFDRIKNGETFFRIYEPLKIYNDERVKEYIKALAV